MRAMQVISVACRVQTKTEQHMMTTPTSVVQHNIGLATLMIAVQRNSMTSASSVRAKTMVTMLDARTTSSPFDWKKSGLNSRSSHVGMGKIGSVVQNQTPANALFHVPTPTE